MAKSTKTTKTQVYLEIKNLRDAAALIVKPGAFAKQAMAYNDGYASHVNPMSDYATCWCAQGALVKTRDAAAPFTLMARVNPTRIGNTMAAKALASSISGRRIATHYDARDTIVLFNDARETTAAQVAAHMLKAADELKTIYDLTAKGA